MYTHAWAPQYLSVVVRGELGLGVWLYLDLVLNRQPYSGVGMLVLCHFVDHTYVVIHTHKDFEQDGPKSVPVLALD